MSGFIDAMVIIVCWSALQVKSQHHEICSKKSVCTELKTNSLVITDHGIFTKDFSGKIPSFDFHAIRGMVTSCQPEVLYQGSTYISGVEVPVYKFSDHHHLVAVATKNCAILSPSLTITWPGRHGKSDLVFDMGKNISYGTSAPLGTLTNIVPYRGQLVNCPPTPKPVACHASGFPSVGCVTGKGKIIRCRLVEWHINSSWKLLPKITPVAESGSVSFNPAARAVSGVYVIVPDLRSPSGGHIFYDERTSCVWTAKGTLLVSHVDDKITVVKTFKLPEKPQFGPDSDQYSKAVDDIASNAARYITNSGTSRRSRRGIFSTIGCAIDSIFGASCKSGSNSQATRLAAKAVQANSDAITSVEGQVKALIKSENGLSHMIGTNRETINQNAEAIKTLSNHLTVEMTNNIANMRGDMLGINLRVTYLHMVTNYRISIEHFINEITDYINVVDAASSTYPSIDAITKILKGTVPNTNIHARNCRLVSSRSFMSDTGYQFVINANCPQIDQRYTVYYPSPVVMSHSGEQYIGPADATLENVLLAADSTSSSCDSVSTPLGTYRLNQKLSEGLQNGGQCLAHRMLITKKTSLAACDGYTESSTFCYSYQVNVVDPPFWEDGPLFPYKGKDHMFAKEYPNHPIFPFTTLNGQLMLLNVPSRVYSPPNLNTMFPAGTVFSAGLTRGRVIPALKSYSGHQFSSVELPPVIHQTDREFVSNFTYIMAPNPRIPGAARFAAKIKNETAHLIQNLFKDNVAFGHAIDKYEEVTNVKYKNETAQFNDDIAKVISLESSVRTSIKSAKDLANASLSEKDESKSTLHIWINTGLGITALLLGGTSVYLLVFGSGVGAATIGPISSNTIESSGLDSTISFFMPYIILGMLGYLTMNSLYIIMRSFCKKTKTGKVFREFITLMSASAYFIYIINQIHPLTGLHKLFTHTFLLAFCFITHGFTACGYLMILTTCSVEGFDLLTTTTTDPFNADLTLPPITPEVVVNESDCESVSIQRWIFLGVSSFFLITTIAVILANRFIKNRIIPMSWKAPPMQRFRALFTCYTPIAVTLYGNRTTLKGKGTSIVGKFLVGYAEHYNSIKSITIPDSHHEEAKAAIISTSRVKTFFLKNMFDPFVNYDKFDNNHITVMQNNEELKINCPVSTSSDLYNKVSRSELKAVLRKDAMVERVTEMGAKSSCMIPAKHQTVMGMEDELPLSKVYNKQGRVILVESDYPCILKMAQENQIKVPKLYREFMKNPKQHLDKLGYINKGVVGSDWDEASLNSAYDFNEDVDLD